VGVLVTSQLRTEDQPASSAFGKASRLRAITHNPDWKLILSLKSQMIEPEAKTRLQRHLTSLFCDFGVRLVTLQRMQEAIVNDLPALDAYLQEWERLGYLRIIHDVSTASPQDVCVNILSPIGPTPFPY
jgi:hypothetical protein